MSIPDREKDAIMGRPWKEDLTAKERIERKKEKPMPKKQESEDRGQKPAVNVAEFKAALEKICAAHNITHPLDILIETGTATLRKLTDEEAASIRNKPKGPTAPATAVDGIISVLEAYSMAWIEEETCRPEDRRDVLAYMAEADDYIVAYFDAGAWWIGDYDQAVLGVTHWTPLPAAPTTNNQ